MIVGFNGKQGGSVGRSKYKNGLTKPFLSYFRIGYTLEYSRGRAGVNGSAGDLWRAVFGV